MRAGLAGIHLDISTAQQQLSLAMPLALPMPSTRWPERQQMFFHAWPVLQNCEVLRAEPAGAAGRDWSLHPALHSSSGSAWPHGSSLQASNHLGSPSERLELQSASSNFVYSATWQAAPSVTLFRPHTGAYTHSSDYLNIVAALVAQCPSK